MKRSRGAAVLALSLALPGTGAAGGAGTTAANFLKIPVGPRQVGMGDQGVALSDDAFSPNYNPATLAALDSQELAFMHNQWAEGITQEYLGYVYPKLSLGSIGAGLNFFRVGAFQGYDANGGRAGDVSAEDLSGSLGYARRVWGHPDPEDGPGLLAGIAAKYVRERLENESASAYAADAGVLLRAAVRDSVLGIGAAAQNLGSGPSYYGRRSRLPQTYSLGASLSTRRPWGDPLTLSLEARKPSDNSLSFSLGGEYWVSSLFAFRLGYRSADELGPGVRGGFGIKVKAFQFDYGMSLLGSFGVGHRAGVTYRIGAPVQRTPEPSRQAKLAKKALQRARHLMGQERYLEALLEINRALELEPTSPDALALLDQVQKYMKQIESQSP